jgi:hypothetical protein
MYGSGRGSLDTKHTGLRSAKRTLHYCTCVRLDRTHSLKNQSRSITNVYNAVLYRTSLTRRTLVRSQHCTNTRLVSAACDSCAVDKWRGSYLSEQGDTAAGPIAYCTMLWNSVQVGRGGGDCSPGPTDYECTIFVEITQLNGAGSFFTSWPVLSYTRSSPEFYGTPKVC